MTWINIVTTDYERDKFHVHTKWQTRIAATRRHSQLACVFRHGPKF